MSDKKKKPKFEILFRRDKSPKDDAPKNENAMDPNWFYDPGPGFNNKHYDDFMGRWGANMPGGEPTIQQVVAVIEALMVLTQHFNELMAAGKGEDISKFLDATDKFADRAVASSNPMVQAGGMMIKSMVMVLRKGLSQGYLTNDQVGEITTGASEWEKKWREIFEPSGTVGDREIEPEKI